MKKFENIRVYNFQNAVRALHNQDSSWDKSDSKFGLCKNEEVLRLSLEKLNNYGEPYTDHDIIAEYHNIVLWNYDGNIEYAVIGPKDMELAKKDEWFLENIGVSYDIVDDEGVKTVFVHYSDLYGAYYNEPSEDLKKMIEQLPYAYDLIMNS